VHESEQLRAAIDRLEAERARRIAEKIESGTAVLVPFRMVAGYEPDEASVKRAKEERLAELRAQGETREVFFDETIIVTGVFRSEDEQFGPMPETHCSTPAPDVRVMEQPKEPEPREETELATTVAPPTTPTRIWVQTKAATGDDPGVIAEGKYTVADGVLCLTDLEGKPIGSVALRPDQDPAAVARQLLRAKTALTGFWAPLPARKWWQ
jgi:hypothetical protein